MAYPFFHADELQAELVVLLKYAFDQPPSVDTVMWSARGTLAHQLGMTADPSQ
jgi:hypothetical protein